MERETTDRGAKGGRTAAFTLIELLTVIAIIGVLAALLVPLSSVATSKMRLSRVSAELNNLVTMIESYQLEVGGVPPDNARLKNTPTNHPNYTLFLAYNPLSYELSGAVFTNRGGAPIFRTLGNYEEVTPEVLELNFGHRGIQNSSRRAVDVPYRSGSLKSSQVKEALPLGRGGGEHIDLLAVPVPGPRMIPGAEGGDFNAWFYDASSTNRHNRNGYDLWAEIKIGRQTNIVGNWKQ